jgi:hypothetical protein
MKRHAWVAVNFAVASALACFAPGCGGDDTGTGAGGSAGSAGGATGTGGAGGSTGTGGSATGGSTGTGGGAPGTGGGTDAGRDSSTGTGGGGATDGSATDAAEAAALLACSPVPADLSTCNGSAPCTVSCGVNISALTTTAPHRTCTCGGTGGGGDGGGARDGSGGGGMRWSCPTGAGSCIYPTAEVDLNCLVVPSPLPACPHDPVDAGTVPDSGTGLIRTGVSSCMVPSSETCGSICGSASPTVFTYQTSGGTPMSGYCVCIGGIYQCATVNEWFTL